jgi:hypothetical protein
MAFDQRFDGARIQAEGFRDIANPQALRAQSHYLAHQHSALHRPMISRPRLVGACGHEIVPDVLRAHCSVILHRM